MGTACPVVQFSPIARFTRDSMAPAVRQRERARLGRKMGHSSALGTSSERKRWDYYLCATSPAILVPGNRLMRPMQSR